MWIAPAKRSSFSVSVVLPASGCEMMAQVRRCTTLPARTSLEMSLMGRWPAGRYPRPSLEIGESRAFYGFALAQSTRPATGRHEKRLRRGRRGRARKDAEENNRWKWRKVDFLHPAPSTQHPAPSTGYFPGSLKFGTCSNSTL